MLVWIQQFHWHKRGWIRHLKYCLMNWLYRKANWGRGMGWLESRFSALVLILQGHASTSRACSGMCSLVKAKSCGLALQLVLTGTAPMKPSFNSWRNSSFILAAGNLATGCSSQTHITFVYFLHPDSASNPVLFPHDYFAAHFSLKSSLQWYFSAMSSSSLILKCWPEN